MSTTITREEKLNIIDFELVKQTAEAHLLEKKGKAFTAKIYSIAGLQLMRDDLLPAG